MFGVWIIIFVVLLFDVVLLLFFIFDCVCPFSFYDFVLFVVRVFLIVCLLLVLLFWSLACCVFVPFAF